MKICRSIQEVREWRGGVKELAFVPTMGAFHEGHLALMKRGKGLCDTVAVSLFVNPLQFGEGEDLSRYPKQESEDFAMAESVGVDMIYAPPASELTQDLRTKVSVSGVSDAWEGTHRPGHFDGVATIVSKLFMIVQPDYAVFGLKDLQQCAVVRQMVADLNFPVQLDFLETVREPSGLALSSRNKYFSDSERELASALHSTLSKCAKRLMNTESYSLVLDEAVEQLSGFGFDVEYLAVVDPQSLTALKSYRQGARIIVAARFCGVRLIDNIAIAD